MTFLVAAVVLVGAVAALNLVLTAAVIRRMRQYESDRSSGASQTPYDVLGGLLPGAALPAFRGTAIDGRTVTDHDLRDRPAAVAFLSTDCPGCLERAPEFAAAARAIMARGGRAIAVIIQGAEPADALTAAVDPAAIVSEPADRSGPMTRAFAVKTFPTFFVIDAAGAITSRDLEPQPELAPTGRS